MPNFKDERIWRWLTNIWTIFFLAFIILNFTKANYYDYLVSPLCALYVGVLTLYVGTKEFSRWSKNYTGRFSGEIFVIVWSLIIFILFALSILLGKEYKIPSDIVATYIAVITIFALTQKSKRIFQNKNKK